MYQRDYQEKENVSDRPLSPRAPLTAIAGKQSPPIFIKKSQKHKPVETEESSTDVDSVSVGIPPKSLKHMREKVYHIIQNMGEAQPILQEDSSSDISTTYNESSCYDTTCANIATQEKQPPGLSPDARCPCIRTTHQPQQTCGKVHVDQRTTIEVPSEPKTAQLVMKICHNPPPPRREPSPATIVSTGTRSHMQIPQYPKINSCRCPPISQQLEQCSPQSPTIPCTCHPVQVESSSSEETLLCPCDCEPGPHSPCVAKRTATTKIKDFICKLAGGSVDSTKPQMEHQNQLYAFKMKDKPTKPPPRRLVFELIDGIPKAMIPHQEKITQTEVEVIEKAEVGVPVQTDLQEYKNVEAKSIFETAKEKFGQFIEVPVNEKVEVYYFDHGNSGYYRTTDCPPTLVTDDFFEQTDMYATRFWAEIFGTLHIGLSFVTALFLQLLRFILYSILRPLIVGSIQLASDYFFKPLLSILFNGVIQPVLILFYNVATSMRDVCEPIAQGLGFFIREVGNLCRTIRLVDINTVRMPGKDRPSCHCHPIKKV